MITSRELETERYILSTMPVLYVPLWKRDGSSLISDDAYGHVCTVTGATGGLAGWTPQGRKFDGVDDYVSVSNHTVLQMTSEITVLVWANPNSVFINTPSWLVARDVSGNRAWAYGITSNYKMTAQHSGLNIGETGGLAPGNYLSVFSFFGFRYSSSLSVFDYFYNANLIKTYTSPATIASTTNALFIGKREYVGSTLEFAGTIGEVLIYDRGLSPLEQANIYEVTKWRYQ